MPRNKLLRPILLMILIFGESSIPMDGFMPMDKGPGVFAFLTNFNPDIQNLLHIPLYGILCFLWLQYFKAVGLGKIQGIVYSLLITIFYGGFDEFHQSFVPGRYGGLLDIYLNTAGAVSAVVAVLYFQTKRN